MNTHNELPHDAAVELLPWLVNDSLPEDEKRDVMAHARNCVACRKDLAELEALRDTMTVGAEEWEVPPVDMRRINRRIDAYQEQQERIPRMIRSFGAFLVNPWRAAVVLQALVIAGLLGALLVRDADRGRYTTLTNASSLAPGSYLRLVVSTATGTDGLRDLLDRHGLELIEGPSERGVATVALPHTAGDAEQRELVRQLSGHPLLRYVQPLTVTE